MSPIFGGGEGGRRGTVDTTTLETRLRIVSSVHVRFGSIRQDGSLNVLSRSTHNFHNPVKITSVQFGVYRTPNIDQY